MMKGIFITINLLIINVILLNAQGFEWANFISPTGSMEVNDIKTDVNGNLYGVGGFQGTMDFDPGSGIYNLTSTSNSTDLFIINLDSTGSFNWVKVLEIWGSQSRISSFIFDTYGDLLICGYFNYSGDFDPGPGVYTLNSSDGNQFILKLDANGNFLWAKNFGGTGVNSNHSIAVDVQNHILITGILDSPSDMDPGPGTFTLNNGTFILKLDSAANFIWAKSISGAVGIYLRIDQSDHILVSGDFENTVDFDPGASVNYHTSNGMQDQFILSLNSLGEFNWVRTFGGINEDELRGFQNDNDGNIWVTGNFIGSIDFDPGSNVYILQSGISSIYLLKLDLNGNFVWASSIGNSLGLWDYTNHLAVDNFDNVYLTGFGTGLNDFDPGPNVYNLLCGAGSGDIFILKVDSTGDFQWAIIMGDVHHDWSKAITIDNAGNIYSTGHFRGTVDFNPGYQIFNLTTTGNLFNSYFLKLNNCFFINEISSSPTNFNSPNCNGSVAINPIGGTPPYSISWSSGITNNLCEGWYTTTITDANGCIETDSVYVNLVIGIEELNSAGNSFYPNPVKDVLTINSEKEIGETKIYDVVGKLIYSEVIKNKNAEIDVKEFDAGIYFVEINNSRVKVVKM